MSQWLLTPLIPPTMVESSSCVSGEAKVSNIRVRGTSAGKGEDSPYRHFALAAGNAPLTDMMLVPLYMSHLKPCRIAGLP